MKTVTTAAVLGVVLVVVGQNGVARPAERPAVARTAEASSAVPTGALAAAATVVPTVSSAAAVPQQALTGVVQRYCQTCHNDQLQTGNLTLQSFDVAKAAEQAETAEKVIRKLRAGMMPPPRMPRPGGDTLEVLVQTLEKLVDDAAARRPHPGTRVFQRLNRREYERAIEDLLGLQVNAGDWLTLDTYLAKFDNMAAAQALSPMLLDGYMNAAAEISRLALGNPNELPSPKTYKMPVYGSQHPWDYVEGAPYGTRGGMVVTHHFPADGDYVFELGMNSQAGGESRFEDIDVSVDGEQVALLHVESAVSLRERVPGVRTVPVFVRAGQHQVSAAFIRKAEGPYEDLMRPHDWSMAGRGSASYGTTSLPHLEEMKVVGPYNARGVSETETRKRIFSCYPKTPAEERSCAQSIITQLTARAYRRPVTDEDVDGLMSFYETEAAKHGFEVGIRTALQAILASPHFVFRVERAPTDADPGEVFAVRDLELASRLSFFLWGTPPDDELRKLAMDGDLSNEKVLERQARRMLADPRSEALATRFAAQWLRLQDMNKVHPDAFWFPNFDEQIAQAMRRETELFFDNLVREDRSLLELYTADYTFVNERLARHYGFPDVVGRQFRRVSYPDAGRKGILGHGSVLLLTSLGNRTSPVLRGKWVMEVILGIDPPPPPPGVPDLEETADAKDGRFLTTRERMEMHRANPICSACHQFMDPIGLALDNFDVTGQTRLRENGMTLDTRGTFYDGTNISTPNELTQVLIKRPLPLVRNFSRNLLAYAIGRQVVYSDMPTVRAIARDAAEQDYRLSSFILGVVMSDPFRLKQAEARAADGAGQGGR